MARTRFAHSHSLEFLLYTVMLLIPATYDHLRDKVALRFSVLMRTFAICSAAQTHSIRHNTSCISTSHFKQASFATYRVNENRHIKPCQRSNSVHSRQKLNIVAARTESAEMPVGNAVPDFMVSLVRGLHHEYHVKATCELCALLQLLEPLTGTSVSLQQAKGQKGTLLVFMCNHCPFVIHLRGQVLGWMQKQS